MWRADENFILDEQALMKSVISLRGKLKNQSVTNWWEVMKLKKYTYTFYLLFGFNDEFLNQIETLKFKIRFKNISTINFGNRNGKHVDLSSKMFNYYKSP